ncbi:Orn/DAP/Arg decarboxylase 2 [Calothrix sp. PCC 7716]|nr:Orn/DAP/Arg decarboxylase 2 [Calothrix sp. PCC 7716]
MENLIKELLDVYGSPLYIYDANKLRQNINHISASVRYDRTQFRFASVTNGNVALLKIFKDCGWGLHANTPGDVYLGLQAGFNPEKVVYSGSNLNSDEMLMVLKWGVRTFNLDSVSQVKLFCQVYGLWNEPQRTQRTQREEVREVRLGLRLNFPELTGDSRIGVHPDDFGKASSIARDAGLKVNGLHFYRGTGTNATTAFTQAIESVFSVAGKLPDWEYLDFGGGFGYPYRHGGAAFDWEFFGAELTRCLEKLNNSIELVIEPGRAAIAGCAILLAKVVSVKWQSEKQIVGVDTTVANLSVPSVHGGYREIIAYPSSTSSDLYQTDVCGNTTYSRDYLGKNCLLPALNINDIIAILDVGAYGYAMSSHFLHRPRPAEVLIENGNHRLIRKREDYSVLLANQII